MTSPPPPPAVKYGTRPEAFLAEVSAEIREQEEEEGVRALGGTGLRPMDNVQSALRGARRARLRGAAGRNSVWFPIHCVRAGRALRALSPCDTDLAWPLSQPRR